MIQSSPANEDKENENTDGEDGNRQEQKEKDAHNFLSQAVKACLTIEYQRLNPEEILKGQEAGIFNANFEFKDVQVGQRVLIKYNFHHVN